MVTHNGNLLVWSVHTHSPEIHSGDCAPHVADVQNLCFKVVHRAGEWDELHKEETEEGFSKRGLKGRQEQQLRADGGQGST